MKKNLIVNIAQCPHCGEEIMIAYTKKALKKILKAIAFSQGSMIEISALIDVDGVIFYHVEGEL